DLLAKGVLLFRALVAEQVDAATDVADEQVDQAVAVPIDRVHRRRGASDRDRLVRRARDAFAVVGANVPSALVLFVLPVDGAADDEYAAPRLLLDAAADVDDVAVLVLEHLGRRELALGLALEKEDLPGPGAGDEIGDAVAVEVHQLGTEADASARRHAAVFVA